LHEDIGLALDIVCAVVRGVMTGEEWNPPEPIVLAPLGMLAYVVGLIPPIGMLTLLVYIGDTGLGEADC